MHKRMLIDTTHAEETRVVVMDGDRLEDYDVETTARKQIKGNIYLAKVIRIEPSLQAAFVDYGGNRHGFLAFSEIHPDYFQIPVSDREELLALQNAEGDEVPEEVSTQDESVEPHVDGDAHFDDDAHEQTGPEPQPAPEIVGGENDTGEESSSARRMARFLRNYRIQEVIRRRQIILVQVVKEERGNKGAALTTYISLPGRYCVLMPNALRGGGVSRKITSENDRRRLRDIIAELNLPRSIAMIVRTAGAQRPGPEITRDCEYLLQLWDQIRDRTLSSTAPELVYEEANLIKRAVRDLFSKDISEIMVDGEAGWKSAKEFMRNLMPHNANLVKLWRNNGQSLFARHRVEGHLDAIFSPTATLKSGGYIVINQTEALVAIDVNSGRSTGQRNIEDTALRTNLEAADEVARQLRLRDLAGLVVIDFIDMESRRHNAMVEKRLKEALKADRARIQIGQISHFGLLEMSRQRLRASIAEAMLTPCPHCKGMGFIRGTESAALQVLRAIDEEGLRQRAAEIAVHVSTEVALYILNQKRQWLAEIEQRHMMDVQFVTDDSLIAAGMRIERTRAQDAASPNYSARTRVNPTRETHDDVTADDNLEVSGAETHDEAKVVSALHGTAMQDAETGEGGRRRRRRRRSRGGRRQEQHDGDQNLAPESGDDDTQGKAAQSVGSDAQMPREPRIVRQIEISDPQSITARQSRSNAAPKAPPIAAVEERSWRGRPTPADPFAGASFDIYDMIDETSIVEDVTLNETSAPSRPTSSTHESERLNERRGPRRGLRRARGGRRNDAEPRATSLSNESAERPGGILQSRDSAEAPAQPVTSHAIEVTPMRVAPSEAVETQPTKKPAKTARPTRRRKAPADVTLEATVPETHGVEAQAKEVPKAKAPRRARRTKAEPSEATTAKEAAPIVQPVNVDEIKAPPQRTGWWKR